MEGANYKFEVSVSSALSERAKNEETTNDYIPLEDLLNEFLDAFSNEKTPPEEMRDIMYDIYYYSDLSSYNGFSKSDQIIEAMKVFLQYPSDSILFKGCIKMLYTLCVVSFDEYIKPLDVIEYLVERLRELPEKVTIDLIKLLKMISVNTAENATKVISAIGYELLEHMLDIENDDSGVLQKHTLALIRTFTQTDFNINEFEDFPSWILSLYINKCVNLYRDSSNQFIEIILELKKKYGEEKWKHIVNTSGIREHLWDSFENSETDVTYYLDFLSQVVKYFYQTTEIRFDIINDLIHSEDDKIVKHALHFCKIVLRCNDVSFDFFLSDDFLSFLFDLIENGSFKLKEDGVFVLIEMCENLTGVQVTRIVSFGAVSLLINQIEIYPTSVQSLILDTIDHLLYFGRITEEENRFTEILEEADSIEQLKSLYDNEDIDPSIMEKIEKILKENFGIYREEDEED